MSKNSNLLYCILGSALLALLNTPIFSYAKLGIFPGGYGGYIFGEFLVVLSNYLSLAGFILLIVFSVTLIIRNLIPNQN
ncbi:hypothetical protein [Halalkalibacter akibai]|uniref:hypothetical protein n=1 Tax=Halalkalibacter akibai TaxID=1411 RepID=UPI00068B816A|nr:hypothetical protein [Halalkalibacter akibai]